MNDLIEYAKICENNVWANENFNQAEHLYPESGLDEVVQSVAQTVLDSIKAAQDIRPYLDQGLTFLSVIHYIARDLDQKYTTNTPESIRNASAKERYVMVKVIGVVEQSRPELQKIEIVASSLLFGIGKTKELSGKLVHNEPVALEPPPQELERVALQPTLEGLESLCDGMRTNLESLRKLRAGLPAGQAFLAIVDANIAAFQSQLDGLEKTLADRKEPS